MNIIIEGPEATGKTTLANKLIEKYNLGYEHLTSKTPNDFEYHNLLLDKENMVYDRFFLGELIYPKIYKRNGKLSFLESLHLLDKITNQNDILIIMYSSDIDILRKRLIERGENEFLPEIEMQNKYFKHYIDIYDNFNCIIPVDIAKENAYELLDIEIQNRVENKKLIKK